MTEQVINKQAKIVIKTEYMIYGRVLDITPTHHIIETSKGQVKAVLNDRVVLVESKQMERFDSPIE